MVSKAPGGVQAGTEGASVQVWDDSVPGRGNVVCSARQGVSEEGVKKESIVLGVCVLCVPQVS